jgi:tape measure domain-containing protein
MANDEDFEIVVTIDPTQGKRGADVIDRELIGMERQAKKSSEAMSKSIGDGMRKAASDARRSDLAGAVGRSVAGLATAFGAREAMDMADAYTNATSQLRAMHGATQAQIIAQRELFKSAQETGSEFGSVVGLYRQVGKAVTDMGGSQRQAIETVDTLTKAIKASGASGASADAALTQLSQGLGAGALRGEEFNSVLEQAPIIIDLIAKSLGKTRGEMRAMANEGKLTSQVVISALKSQRQEVLDQYAERLPTFAEQWTKFRNEASKSLSEFAQNTRAVELLGSALAGLADSLRMVASVGAMASKAVGELGDISIGGYQLDGGALWRGVSTARRYLNPITGSYNAASDIYGAVQDSGKGSRVGDLVDTLKEISRHTEGMKGLLADVAKNTEFGGFAGMAQRLEQKDAVAKFVAEQQAAALIPIATRAMIQGVGDGAKSRQAQMKRDKDAADAMKRLRDEYNSFLGSLSDVTAAEQELEKAQRLLDRAVRAHLTTQEEANALMAQREEMLRDQLDPYAAVVREIEREIVLLGQSEEVRNRTTRLLEIENDLRGKGVELTSEQWGQLDELVRAEEAAARAADQRAEAEAKAANAAQERFELLQDVREKMRALAEVEREVAAKAKEDFERPMMELEGAMKNEFAGAFDEALRSAIAFENNFSQIVQNLLKEIALLIAKMLLLQAVQAGFGTTGAGGQPALTSMGGLLAGLITGGNFAGGGQFRVGGTGGPDSQGVFFRATPGEIVTVTNPGLAANSNAPSGGVSVPLSITLAGDPNALVATFLRSSEGEQVVIDIFAKHTGKLRGALAR